MRVVAVASSLVVVSLLPLASGCANNSYALGRQNQTLQQEQVALQQRNTELQNRANTLDRDNQELETLLAQSRQQAKVVEDQLAAVRDQLATATAQLAQARDEKVLSDKQTEALLASRRRSGAQITANNSLRHNLPALNLPGVEVRNDGDVVRVELPAARLFQVSSTTLQPAAGPLLDSVAAEIARAYPEQMIGVEGHTDTDFVRGAPGVDNQQISVARATAVYQYLAARGQIASTRMFIVGHGSSHPVVSNATAAGKARNSRVELVIYPDKPTATR